MSLNFQKVFDEYSESTKRQWAHDRTKTIGASEAFQCLRRNYFMKRGYSPDPGYAESYGATTRGSLMEAHYVVPAIRSQLPPGAAAIWMGDDQVSLIKDRLSATPDGLIHGLKKDALKDYGIDDIITDEILVEIKSFDPRLKLDEPKPVHAGQVQQQMGLVHETTNHRPEYAVILYVNASWMDDIRVFVIKRDPSLYEVCKKRADMVYDATDPTQLAPEGKVKGGSECDYCPFQKQCSMAQIGKVPTGLTKGMLSEAEQIDLRVLAAKHSSISSQIKKLTVEKETASEAVKAFLRKHGKRYARTEDGYDVSYTVVPGRKSYDIEKIVEDTGIDLADYTTVGDPSERLTVKAPKGEPDDVS